MGFFQKDYIVRLLEELTQSLEAIRALIEGGRERAAVEAIRQARATLAGPMAAMLERVDAASVVALIGKERAGAYLKLARLEAQARAALGESGAARAAQIRADELELAL
jgi:hypothetical protein